MTDYQNSSSRIPNLFDCSWFPELGSWCLGSKLGFPYLGKIPFGLREQSQKVVASRKARRKIWVSKGQSQKKINNS